MTLTWYLAVRLPLSLPSGIQDTLSEEEFTTVALKSWGILHRGVQLEQEQEARRRGKGQGEKNKEQGARSKEQEEQ